MKTYPDKVSTTPLQSDADGCRPRPVPVRIARLRNADKYTVEAVRAQIGLSPTPAAILQTFLSSEHWIVYFLPTLPTRVR